MGFYIVLVPFHKEFSENNVHKIHNPDYPNCNLYKFSNFILLK